SVRGQSSASGHAPLPAVVAPASGGRGAPRPHPSARMPQRRQPMPMPRRQEAEPMPVPDRKAKAKAKDTPPPRERGGESVRGKKDKKKGQVVDGKYQLGQILGKGAFGQVFYGLNIQTGDSVAVKRIPVGNVSKEQLKPIQQEIELMSRLGHPNIVKYIGSSRTAEYLYIVIEYVESGSLQAMVKRFGSLEEHLVARYIAQVLEGLMYLHDQGTIHRDIKGGWM
ncbi:hypothetical protein KIPB_010909, partial [Kipferlia bialata]